jgi:hypothetical protein
LTREGSRDSSSAKVLSKHRPSKSKQLVKSEVRKELLNFKKYTSKSKELLPRSTQKKPVSLKSIKRKVNTIQHRMNFLKKNSPPPPGKSNSLTNPFFKSAISHKSQGSQPESRDYHAARPPRLENTLDEEAEETKDLVTIGTQTKESHFLPSEVGLQKIANLNYLKKHSQSYSHTINTPIRERKLKPKSRPMSPKINPDLREFGTDEVFPSENFYFLSSS